MQQILLSISMLASNRKDTIRRALDSLKPIMEQIPCELILVDTSTDPEVPPILQEYTDKIIKFKWINDFSAARNMFFRFCFPGGSKSPKVYRRW